MINIKNLENEEYLALYKKSLENRGGEISQLDKVLELNTKRKSLTFEIETRKNEQKKISQVIGQKKKNKENADSEMAAVAEFKTQIKAMEEDCDQVIQDLDLMLLQLPNKVHESVPVGRSDKDNRVERAHGEAPQFSFQPKPHYEIAEALGIVDFERAAKVAGARFSFLLGWGAKLERALANFMLDVHTELNGYKEVLPPYLVNTESMYGTGQFPKFQEDVFHVKGFPYYLIPTAEAPMTNYFRNECSMKKTYHKSLLPTLLVFAPKPEAMARTPRA